MAKAAYWSLGDSAAGDGFTSIEPVLMNFAGGIDPAENLIWVRPDQIGTCNWSFFDSPDFKALYQSSSIVLNAGNRGALVTQMEDTMELSGGFVLICAKPCLAIHDTAYLQVILADGHRDPVAFRIR